MKDKSCICFIAAELLLGMLGIVLNIEWKAQAYYLNKALLFQPIILLGYIMKKNYTLIR
ncbi:MULTISPECIES: hypothetical protein [Clostridium]|uniref:hypothetical protein n=1 Tax=Clostridium TaxID=1485 RepID=UPI0019D49F6B|nr:MULTISPECIES: hypothetical protein [Clostridium]